MITLSSSTINQQSSSSHGTYHLADNPNLFEIQRSNNFEFIISDFDSLNYAGSTETTTSKLVGGQELIRLAVSAASIPHFTQSAIEVKRGNNIIKYAGVPEFGDGKLTVIDYIGADTLSLLMAWQNLTYNVATEKVGLAESYKRSCTLIEYSPDYQVVREWKMFGCWISDIKEDDMDSERAEARKIEATIIYDHAQIDYDSVL